MTVIGKIFLTDFILFILGCIGYWVYDPNPFFEDNSLLLRFICQFMVVTFAILPVLLIIMIWWPWNG